MNKNFLKSICICLVCGISLFNTGCEKEQSSGKGYLFNYTMMTNPQNLDPQVTTDSNSITIINNTFTGLMQEDSNGNLSCGVAKDYTVSNDGLRYVFYLRDDYKWYSKDESTLDVTAYDFLFTFYRIFNPETQSPYIEKFACLKNAQAIINSNDEVSYMDIGVYASDKYTITFLLDYPNSDFLRLLAQSYTVPCNEDFFNSTHSTYGLYDDAIISNGAFYIKQWFYDKYGKDNFLTLRRNPVNPKYDDYSPYAVQITIDEDTELSDIEHALYKNETDLYYSNTVDSSSVDKDDIVLEYETSTIGAVFNINDDYFKDSNLRNAFIYSMDKQEALKKSSLDITVAYGLVPSASKFKGQSYRSLVDESTLVDTSKYSKEVYISEFNKAKKKLGEIPQIRIIMENGTVDSSYIKSLVDSWSNIFGVTILMDSLVTEEYNKAIDNGDYQIAISSINAQDDRPYSFLSNFLTTNRYFDYSNIEVDTILKASEHSLSDESTISMYTQVEKTILEDNIFVPLYYNKTYLVCVNGTDLVDYNPFNHQFDFSYAVNYNQED